MSAQSGGFEIAVIGMAGRWPGADDVRQLWKNLREGVESIARFDEEEVLAAGVPPELVRDPRYVRAGGHLEGADLFDAAFFGFSPREAEIMDPQHRVFLECAWAALEAAGHAPGGLSVPVGMFGSVGGSGYILENLARHPTHAASLQDVATTVGTDKDFLASRVSYKLNLKGPAVVVQTACSSSLVAVHLACQSLLSGESDVALAGGVSIDVPMKTGYLFQEEGIYSPDGHCRAFDAAARGMVGGSGAAVVVLRRLDDALLDRDHVHAVVRGSAINNDGSVKVGYTAPSVQAQAEVIRMAHVVAEVEPDSIGYVEAHGTATELGDPIEVAALTQAFREGTDAVGTCKLGSIKTNIGHLNTAAGVTGLVKAVLAVEHGIIPPSLHFETPNPRLCLEQSPFRVAAELSEWTGGGAPRRAGVSSFGMGGTNAHVVLEQAPELPPPAAARPAELIVLSGRTRRDLDETTRRIRVCLERDEACDLGDVAFTLASGRKRFDHRRIVVASDPADAVSALAAEKSRRVITQTSGLSSCRVAFMFPGQGSQHVSMARQVYDAEPTFRQQLDQAATKLQGKLGVDLLALFYPTRGVEEAAARLTETAITQPALFVVEHALARLWMSWGIEPTAMIGHSIGEFVAACISGVMSYDDALNLVVTRGRLMGDMPGGSMLAVGLPEGEVLPLLDDELTVAALNEVSTCVVSGPTERVEALETELSEREIGVSLLRTSHAFHSKMMDPILAPFEELLRKVELAPPRIPYVSNVTGTWIRDEEATDPAYWAKHLRQPVRFADGLAALLEESEGLVLEVGPGRTLGTFARRHPARSDAHHVVSSLPHPDDDRGELSALLEAAGRLWLAGAELDWSALHGGLRRRMPLPTYPFDRRRFWVRPQPDPLRASRPGKRADVAEWLYVPSWKRTGSPLVGGVAADEQEGPWIVTCDPGGWGAALAAELSRTGRSVVTVEPGGSQRERAGSAFEVNPSRPEDFAKVMRRVAEQRGAPSHVVHCWNVGEGVEAPGLPRPAGYHAVLGMARALADLPGDGTVKLTLVTSGVHEVIGGEVIDPERATLLGACRVIPLEMQRVACRCIDLAAGDSPNPASVARLAAELRTVSDDPVVAHRGPYRWVPAFELQALPESPDGPDRLREGGAVLVTGGLGGMGLVLARHLADTRRARLVLTGRTPLPTRSEWDAWLEAHDESDPASQRLRAVRDLESRGAEVLPLTADVTDLARMTEVVAVARERFGDIAGVIHAAGVPGGEAIALKAPDAQSPVLATKLEGALVLDRLFADDALDVMVLCSSLASEIGGFGQADYCAANAFLDAFAAVRDARRPGLTVAIDWDTWNETGMAVTTEVPAELRAEREEQLRLGLTNADGCEILSRVLHADFPRILVSTRDLEPRIAPPPDAVVGLDDSGGPDDDTEAHERPELGDEYVAPSDEVERSVAAVWQSLFGIDRIGIHDDFFELGGHSLLATQVLNRLRTSYPEAPLSLRSLFEMPTVAGLAAIVRGSAAAAGPADALAARVLAARADAREALLGEYVAAVVAGNLELESAPSTLDSEQLRSLAPALIWDIKRDFDLPVYPHELADLATVSEIAAFVAVELARRESIATAPTVDSVPTEPREPRALPAARPAPPPLAEKNPRMVFLLSAPRSGSTLLRLMLAGHSRLFCPPELGLLEFQTMGEWSERAQTFTQDGIVHALKALSGDLDAATAEVRALAERDAPTHEVYRELCRRAGKRLLVDKTPGYALNPATLARMEAEFDEPLYLYLVRHPAPSIHSFVRQRMGKLLGETTEDPWHFAEAVWRDANANVASLLEGVASDRWHLVRYEDLVQQSEDVMRATCEFLGLPFEESTLRPYDPGRMIDGPGDPDIVRHDAIDPSLASAWKTIRLPRSLAQASRDLAVSLGYERGSTEGTGALVPSPSQMRLLFSHRLEPDSPVHNMRSAWKFEGTLDVEALERALGEVARRHEALRTVFPSEAESAKVALTDTAPDFRFVDLSHLERADRATELERRVADLVCDPFDLSAGPLLRCGAFRLADEAHALVVVAHHAACDAWSMDVLVRELTTLTDAFHAGDASPLAELSARYSDFAAWQEKLLAGSELDSLRAYWKEQLADLPELALPRDHAPAPGPTFPGKRFYRTLSAELSQRVQALARAEGVTPFAVLLTAFATLLGRVTGGEDVVVGTPMANRNRPEFEPLIGYFVNVLPLRVDLAGDPDVRTLLERVTRTTSGAFAHQDLPVQQIAEALKLGRRPLFHVMLQHQSGAVEPPTLGGSPLVSMPVDVGWTKLDLTLSFAEGGAGIEGTWEYRTDIFEAATVRRLADDFEAVLSHLVAHPDEALSALPAIESDGSQGVAASLASEATDDDEPRTAWETVLAKSWREALEVDRVGLYDRFFELGGHSLLAMQLLETLEQVTGLRIPPGELFTQTLGQLAESCRERQADPTPAKLSEETAETRKGLGVKLLSAIRKAVSAGGRTGGS